MASAIIEHMFEKLDADADAADLAAVESELVTLAGLDQALTWLLPALDAEPAAA